MIDYEYYYEQYCHVPNNSGTTQKDLIDYHSSVSASTYNVWSRSTKPSLATTYIDGNALLNLTQSPYNRKDLFPRGKYRRKPLISYEKKINTSNVAISLIPIEKTTPDTTTTRSSQSSMTSLLPDIQQKQTDNRIFSAVVFDDKNSEAKIYGRRATTNANGGWIRRYKAIDQSQMLINLLRDQRLRDKTSVRKRTCQQSAIFSASSNSSRNKLRQEKCE